MSAAKKIILLLWLVVASFTTASALTPGATETRVGQKSFAPLESRQAEPFQTAGLHQENAGCGYELAPESLLAAKSELGILGKGSTADLAKGTTLPRNLREQLAIEQAAASPAAGTKLPINMTDPRWPGAQGWEKWQQVIKPGGDPINVHYLRNPVTGQIDDFKIVVPGAR